MKATKKEVELALADMAGKYGTLVWYARFDPDSQIKGVLIAQMQCEKDYPDEVEALVECEDNWQHGFNSGMLAGVRYALTCFELGIDQANEWFPELDT